MRAVPQSVFYVCMSEQRSTGASPSEERLCVRYVFCMRAPLSVYIHIHTVLTYAKMDLFLPWLFYEQICTLVVLRLMLCE